MRKRIDFGMVFSKFFAFLCVPKSVCGEFLNWWTDKFRFNMFYTDFTSRPNFKMSFSIRKIADDENLNNLEKQYFFARTEDIRFNKMNR
jgi:hypothetical protein